MELENLQPEGQGVKEVEEQEVNAANDVQPNQPEDVNSSNQGEKGAGEPVNQPTNLEEWQKDGRYGKMWKKPDDLYNSYKSIEKSFNDVNPKYTGLLKVLKENGFEAEHLADELKKYADYRNPQSRINQIYNYVNGFLNNDIYSARIQQFFEQLEQEELQRLYPNMSAEQIAKQQAMEKQLEKLETAEKQRQEQLELQNSTNSIMKGLEECEGLAKEYGFKITQEVKNYLLTYCSQQNIDPKYIKAVFRDLYGKQLLEARDKKILANYQARKQKLQDAQIISGGAGKVGNPAPQGDARSKFKAGLEKMFGRT